MAVNDFNAIAPIYSLISRFVFGNSLLKSQIIHLDEIRSTDNVLILGGGTGEMLKFIPLCESIYFLDKSPGMLERARKRRSNQAITFIEADFLDWDFHGSFNVVLCPFFLDCFNDRNLRQAIGKSKVLLTDGGLLMVSDFQKTATNRLLLKGMHLFFKFFAKLESGKLKDIHSEILKMNFKLEQEKFLHRNQVFSRLYRNL